MPLDRGRPLTEHKGIRKTLATMSVALDSLHQSLAHLRTMTAQATEFRVIPFDLRELDGRLNGGLRAGALHEASALSCSLVDDAAATLFLAGVAARGARVGGGPVLWAGGRKDLYAPGLEQAALASAEVSVTRTAGNSQ